MTSQKKWGKVMKYVETNLSLRYFKKAEGVSFSFGFLFLPPTPRRIDSRSTIRVVIKKYLKTIWSICGATGGLRSVPMDHRDWDGVHTKNIPRNHLYLRHWPPKLQISREKWYPIMWRSHKEYKTQALTWYLRSIHRSLLPLLLPPPQSFFQRILDNSFEQNVYTKWWRHYYNLIVTYVSIIKNFKRIF